MSLVTYKSGDEVLVTTLEKEHLLLKDYFASNTGRDLEDYDRSTTNDVVEIRSRLA